MFSPLFIGLTHHLGEIIFINADHIVSLYRAPGHNTTAICCTDDREGEFRKVKETPDEIMMMIQEVTDFPNN
jgi:hypothetical protein